MSDSTQAPAKKKNKLRSKYDPIEDPEMPLGPLSLLHLPLPDPNDDGEEVEETPEIKARKIKALEEYRKQKR